KKGREKPKPRQKDKPQQTTPQKAVSPELAIQKLHKEKISKPTPNPTGQKGVGLSQKILNHLRPNNLCYLQ
ncbi:hypothetical protein, partial [Corynebacterium guaraldiae]|uniref:hypothetical protein n=1 Tax=Corynebacterium guaraldiae TaxID=3051103 RepID=UPI00163D8CA3